MKRQKWIDHIFRLDIPVAWTPNVVARLEGTAIRLRHYANQVTEEAAAVQPDGKWSIKEHIGHLADLEAIHTARLKGLEQRVTTLVAADMSNAKTEAASHNLMSLDDLITDFEIKRKLFLDTFYALDNETQNFAALHPRLNIPMKPVDLLCFTAEHDDHHIASILEIIKQ